MTKQPTPTTSPEAAIQDFNSHPPLIRLTKQEVAQLETIKDLEDRDAAMTAMVRQKRAAAAKPIDD